jgi:hypothetical protein
MAFALMSQDQAILRLARQIDAARKSDSFAVDADDVAALRRRGACELHRICAGFVAAVNSKLTEGALDLAPAAFAPEAFRDSVDNLIQIGFHGREMQIAFQSTSQLFSTEKFLVPHILEGEVRTYNQAMLERFEIRSQLLFFCVQEDTAGWRFFDWRTRHTGPVTPELLAVLMEPLF